MKKKIFLAAIMFVFAFNVNAQNDSMYAMKAGVVVGKSNVNTQVGSVILYKPQTQTGNTFTDARDGNVYQTVTIGNQVWMAENLKYIPSVVGPVTGSGTTPYYYVYGYDGTNVTDAKATANYDTYGVLYNWTAAMVVCPTGWHLPSDAEWKELTVYLGGASDAGSKLKETGTTHWNSPNKVATNETGFTALSGGYRYYNGTFNYVGNGGGFWWCATEFSNYSDFAWYRTMFYNTSNVVSLPYYKEIGLSVRCVRDGDNN